LTIEIDDHGWYRYGRSPLWVKRLVDDTTKSFLSLYEPPFASLLPISSLPVYASLTNLSYPASLSASSFFGANGITPLFTQEVVAAATTVNYGSSVSTIHGLGALVSMAASGAAAVKGGNKVVFERFLKGSGASVKRGEAGRVTELVRLDKEDGERTQWVVRTADGGGGTFDVSHLLSAR
jgi:prenylcysteine oxidase/farnesylcysteine lyase